MFFKAERLAPEAGEPRLCKHNLHGGKQPRGKVPTSSPLAQGQVVREYRAARPRPQPARRLAGSKR